MLAVGIPPPPLISSRSQTVACLLFDFDFPLPRPKKLAVAHNHTRSNTPLQAIANLNDQDNSETSVIATNAASTPSTMDLPGSSDKLKAQKLKVLVKRAESIKKNVSTNVHVPSKADARFCKSILSVNSLNSPAYVTQDSAETKSTRAEKDIKSSVTNFKYDEFHELEPDKPQRSVYKRAELKTSSHLGGWGNVRAVSSSLQQWPSASAGSDFYSRKSFKDLGCSEFMIESLKKQFFLRPSHIQAMTFTPVIEGKSCVIADQSGSGKTLAYLVPIIQRLRLEELQERCKSLSRSPQVLIMVPTAELASQVLNNCRSLSKCGVPFRSMAVTGGFSQRTQMENLEQGVDVLIVTPGRFMFLAKEGFLKLLHLKCVVLDEVDILFNDEEFEVALESLTNYSPGVQYLLVTATLPVLVYNKLTEIFPDCRVIMGPGMHRTSARLEEVLVDCSGEIGTDRTPETAFLNKKSALLQIIEQRAVGKTIVFCNKIETCRRVENILKRFDRKGASVRVLPFHSALTQQSRLANMKEFMCSRTEKCSLFLVCTDRASRGIDFTSVDHVILFDFPRDPSEYVRRVGRTARGAKGKGRAFIFVVGKQVSLAHKIIERSQKGHPLHDVPSAYEFMS